MVKFARSRYFLLGLMFAVSFSSTAAIVSWFGAGSADDIGVGLVNLLAGEDQTNSVMKTEQQFSYCAGIVADGQCGSPATFLHTVTCASDDLVATAGSLAIRDATAAGAGTIIQNVNFAVALLAPVTMTFDVVLTTGLYLDFTTTADVECSASYR
jgi:hypothetical protein